MKVYRSSKSRIAATDYKEVHPKAYAVYNKIRRKSKRRPYIRAKYFRKDKIFIDLFWHHLQEKNWRDRLRRLQYFECAIDLIRNTTTEPLSKENPNNSAEILHRFAGITKQKELFFVQISENKKTDEKRFMSVFPEDI